jgi:hypothetical protein
VRKREYVHRRILDKLAKRAIGCGALLDKIEALHASARGRAESALFVEDCASQFVGSYGVQQIVDETRDGGVPARGLWPEGQDQRVINLNRVGAIDGNSRLVELRHRSSDSEVNTVFNVAQCDGLPEKIIKGSFEDAPKNPDETRQECDAFVKATEATIKHQGEKACYIPSVDEIHMPSFTKFTSADGYYATLIHECNHYAAFRIMPRRSESTRERRIQMVGSTRHNQSEISRR